MTSWLDRNNMSGTIRVGLVFGTKLMLEARKLLLETQPDLDIVYQQTDGALASEEILNVDVDVALVDNRLTSMSGSDFVRRFLRRNQGTEARLPSFILTGPFNSAAMELESIRCGASDFVTEEDSVEELIEVIRKSRDLERTTDFGNLAVFFAQAGIDAGSNKRWLLRLTGLSEQEAKVVEALPGLSNTSELPSRTGMTQTQVRWNLNSLQEKLGLSTRSQLALAFHESGLLLAGEN
jgi:DNA-binding NarL/FixJ family response regulator